MKNTDVSEVRPRVSIGLAVHNGEQYVARAIDSLLAQTFRDFEVIISDNASVDRTQGICLEYARRDTRIRYHRNEANIGQIANLNLLLTMSSGDYFRWAGCDDWWAPEYLERCVEALDRNPRAVLVTCYQRHFADDGRVFYEEYTGQRVDSELAHKRFKRLLWFHQASRYFVDPLYGLLRRSALMRTRLLRPMLGTDQILASELSLLGPFCHVPECLAFRRVTPAMPHGDLLRRFDPKLSDSDWWFERMCWTLASLVVGARLGYRQRISCFWSIALFYAKGKRRRSWRRCRGLVALRTRCRGFWALLAQRVPLGHRSDRGEASARDS